MCEDGEENADTRWAPMLISTANAVIQGLGIGRRILRVVEVADERAAGRSRGRGEMKAPFLPLLSLRFEAR